jgi:hypothetical protein
MITHSTTSPLITSKRSTPFGRAVRVILSVAAWALLIVAVLLTTLLMGWILLGMVLLSSGPSASGVPVPTILLGLLVLTGLLAWLTARYFASWRRVGQTISLIVGLVLLVRHYRKVIEVNGAINIYLKKIQTDSIIAG